MENNDWKCRTTLTPYHDSMSVGHGEQLEKLFDNSWQEFSSKSWLTRYINNPIIFCQLLLCVPKLKIISGDFWNGNIFSLLQTILVC